MADKKEIYGAKKKIGKITTDRDEREKWVNPENEAVVGIQILPISSLVRNYYLKLALRAALLLKRNVISICMHLYSILQHNIVMYINYCFNVGYYIRSFRQLQLGERNCKIVI